MRTRLRRRIRLQVRRKDERTLGHKDEGKMGSLFNLHRNYKKKVDEHFNTSYKIMAENDLKCNYSEKERNNVMRCSINKIHSNLLKIGNKYISPIYPTHIWFTDT